MYLTLIILPLLASVVSGLLGRVVGSRGAQIITSSFIFLTTVLAINIFLEVGFNNTAVTLELFRWIDSESLNVYWGFNFDALTVSMLIPVLVISTLVHIYSIGYMANDPHIQRFFSYLSLFTFMMVILVTANNLLLMFVGWEGVGVCSYLLVSFWYTRIAANQSSLAAFLTNRVGDCFLTIGMFIILWTMGNIDYATIFSLSPYINENIITIIGICLLIGAMAKSSQIGLHVWLPMAMEGPTPVSALIHAATMVTAGVYLLIRSSPLLEYSSTALLLCLWIGAITTVFSSLIGLFQQDIKKVIAYSTMSQLGMMVIAVGLSSYNLALFHLVNHAFYKGLLFLAAGSVIHAVADNQDFRKYGGLRPFLPLTYSVMLIASLSLIAFPFMTGFYSKDFILESAFGQFYFSSYVVYYIASIGAIFTTLYSVKVLYLTFLTNPNGSLSDYKMAHEGDIFMSLPLIILAVFSIFFGYITKDIFIGIATGFFIDNSIFIHPNHEIIIETEFAVPTFYKLLPFFNTVLFTVLALISSEFYPSSLINFKFSRLGYNIFGFFNQRFLVEMFYNKYITNNVLFLGGQTTKVLDKGSVEYLGPHGLAITLTNLSNFIKKLDSGIITNYALYILSGLVFYLFVQYSNIMEDVLLMTLLYGLLILIFTSDYKFVNKYISSVIVQPLTVPNSITISRSQFAIMPYLVLDCPKIILEVLSNIISFFNNYVIIYINSDNFATCSIYLYGFITISLIIYWILNSFKLMKHGVIYDILGSERLPEIYYDRWQYYKATTEKPIMVFGLLILSQHILLALNLYSEQVKVPLLLIFLKAMVLLWAWAIYKCFHYLLEFTKVFHYILGFVLYTFFPLLPIHLVLFSFIFNLTYFCFLHTFSSIYICGLDFYTMNLLPVLTLQLDYITCENIFYIANDELGIYMSDTGSLDNITGLGDANFNPGVSPLGSPLWATGDPGGGSDAGSNISSRSDCPLPHVLVNQLFEPEHRASVIEWINLQAKNILSDLPDVNHVTWNTVNESILEKYLGAFDAMPIAFEPLTDPASDISPPALNLKYYTVKYLVSLQLQQVYNDIPVTVTNAGLAVELKLRNSLYLTDTTFSMDEFKNIINKVYDTERIADNFRIKFLYQEIFGDSTAYINEHFYTNESVVESRIRSPILREVHDIQSSQRRASRINSSPILSAVADLQDNQVEASSEPTNTGMKRKRN